jgi:hypothetical protein
MELLLDCVPRPLHDAVDEIERDCDAESCTVQDGVRGQCFAQALQREMLDWAAKSEAGWVVWHTPGEGWKISPEKMGTNKMATWSKISPTLGRPGKGNWLAVALCRGKRPPSKALSMMRMRCTSCGSGRPETV